MAWDEITLFAMRAAALWVLWNVGRALRANVRAQAAPDTKPILDSWEKLRRMFERVDSQVGKGQGAKPEAEPGTGRKENKNLDSLN